MLMFGGGSYLQDFWSLSLDDTVPSWSQVPLQAPPPARTGKAAILDPLRDRLVFFGGYDGYYFHNDLWQIELRADSAVWSALDDTNPPSERLGQTGVYDAASDRMIVFGGQTGQVFEETWALPLAGPPVWSRLLAEDAPPSPRYDHSAVYDSLRGRMIVFGGGDYLNDLYGLDLAGTARWSILSAAGTLPTGRFGHTAIIDPMRDRMVVYGGRDRRGARNQVFTLALDGPPAWEELHPTGVEPTAGRVGHAAIYEPLNDRMLVFGGANQHNNRYNEVWSLTLEGQGAWTLLAPAGTAPPPEDGQSALYDPLRGRMLVFGGYSTTTAKRNGVWALALNGAETWSQLEPIGDAPDELNYSTAVYDPGRDRVIFCGAPLGGPFADRTAYVLDLATDPPTWSFASADGGGPGRYDHSAIFDSAHDRMLVFGGYSGARIPHDDVIQATVPPSPALLTLTIAPAEGGAVVSDHAGTCLETGTNLTLTATPNLGYAFTGWSGDVTSIENPLVVTMEGSKQITATFTGYIISTHSVPIEGGHVDRVPHQATYAPGTEVTLIANAFLGYGFSHWTGSASGSDNPLVVIADRRKSITANFVGHVVDVTVNPVGAGSVTRSADQPTYAPDSVVTLTAIASPGYEFTGWSGDFVDVANPLALTVDGPKSLVANFAVVPSTCGGWSVLDTLPPAPSARRASTVAYDPLRRRILVFGGYLGRYPDTFLNDLWSLSLTTGTWTRLQPSGGPPSPRDGANLVYDPPRDRMILFGGNQRDDFLADVWSLSLGDAPEWARVTNSGPAPSRRFVSSLVYDSQRDRMLLFGGLTRTDGPKQDLWQITFSGGTSVWTELLVPDPPPARCAHAAVYHPEGDRMIVFAGEHPYQEHFGDTWAPDLANGPTWRKLEPLGSRPSRGRTAPPRTTRRIGAWSSSAAAPAPRCFRTPGRSR